MNAICHLIIPCLILALLDQTKAAEPANEISSGVVVHGNTVELCSPSFQFTLSTADQLRAVSWKNRLTGRTLSLGNGPEVEFDVGLPGQTLVTPKLLVKSGPAKSANDCHEAVFKLAADDPAATATVTYRWNDREPVLHKGCRSSIAATPRGIAC